MSELRDEVGEFVKTTLSRFLEDDVAEIAWGTEIGEGGLGIESIGILEIVVNVEQEYDISIPDEVIEKMASSTFGVLVDEIIALHPRTEGSVR